MAYFAMDNTRRGSMVQSDDKLLKRILEQKQRKRALELKSRNTRIALSDDDDIVVINIGGTRFETKKSTLRNVPSSRLGRLTEDDKHFMPYRKEYYFDRNPAIFQHILDFMRFGSMHIPRNVCCKAINNELKYWDLGDGCISECCRKYYCDVLDSYTTYELVKAQFYHLPTFEDEDSKSKLELNEKRSTLTRWKQNIWMFLDSHESSSAAKVYAVIYYSLTVMSLLSVFLTTLSSCRVPLNIDSLIIDSTPSTATVTDPTIAPNTSHSPNAPPASNIFFENRSKGDNLDRLMSTRPHDALMIFDRACMVIFTIDFILRLAVSPTKRIFFKQIKSWYTLFDLLYLAPVWAEFFMGLYDPAFFTTRTGSLILLVLEAMMTLRVFRLFRLSRHYRGLRVLLLAIKASVGEFILLFIFISLSLTIYGSFIYCVEINRPDGFESVFRGLWWALVTMTTVGYGDIVPKTPGGYVVGCLCALTGIVIIGMVVPMIAGNFILYYSFRHAGSEEIELKKPEFVPPDDDKEPDKHPLNAKISMESGLWYPTSLTEALYEEEEAMGSCEDLRTSFFNSQNKVEPYNAEDMV